MGAHEIPGRRSPLELRLRVPMKYQEDVDAWKAQAAQQQEFDEKGRESPFQVGDRAWVRVEQVPRGANPKTFTSMRGPYRVIRVSDDGLTVSVSHLNRPEIVQVVHAERLQRARVEPDEPLTEEERQILEEAQVVVVEPVGAPLESDGGELAAVEDVPGGQSDAQRTHRKSSANLKASSWGSRVWW
jgi:hypothetical protein